jgi:hypothetical protein
LFVKWKLIKKKINFILNPHCQSRKILKISSERKKQRGKMAEMEEGFCSLISPKGLHRLGT